MSQWQSVLAAQLGTTSLALGDLFRGLRQRRRLLPLLREEVTRRFLLDQAVQAGLTATPVELQQAADDFRRRHGFNLAEQMDTWLRQEGLSVLDFEDALEGDLLIKKLQDHVTKDRVAEHFSADRSQYDRATLRQIVVPREDLARELEMQIREEGRDFAALAREYSLHPTKVGGGALGTVWRRHLPTKVAEVVFMGQAEDVVGPVATTAGFHLFLVEKIQPAELDGPTTVLIREELFGRWMKEQLRRTPIGLPLLAEL